MRSHAGPNMPVIPGSAAGRLETSGIADSGPLPGCRPALTRTLTPLPGLYQDERRLLCYGKEILARAAADIARIRISDHPAQAGDPPWRWPAGPRRCTSRLPHTAAPHLPAAAPWAQMDFGIFRKRDEVMPETLRDSVAAEAEAIQLSVVHTVYQHDTYVDVATGTYDMDCSGYAG